MELEEIKEIIDLLEKSKLHKLSIKRENFELHLPTAPGLGIEIDEDKIEKLRR